MEIAREELARVGGNIWRKDIVAIADFGLHSARRRFHFVDLENERVASYHVSHGTGSDSEHDGWLKRYSNIEGSEASSRGAFMTRSWYVGRYGTSIRLDGLDPTNSNALPRACWYVAVTVWRKTAPPLRRRSHNTICCVTNMAEPTNGPIPARSRRRQLVCRSSTISTTSSLV